MSEGGGHPSPSSRAPSGTEGHDGDLSSSQYPPLDGRIIIAINGLEAHHSDGIADESSITVNTSRLIPSRRLETIEEETTQELAQGQANEVAAQQLPQGQANEVNDFDDIPIDPRLFEPFNFAEHGSPGDTPDLDDMSIVAHNEGYFLQKGKKRALEHDEVPDGVPVTDTTRPLYAGSPQLGPGRKRTRTYENMPTFPDFGHFQKPMQAGYDYLTLGAEARFQVPGGHELGPSPEAWVTGCLTRESHVVPIGLFTEPIRATFDGDPMATGRWSIKYALAVQGSKTVAQEMNGNQAYDPASLGSGFGYDTSTVIPDAQEKNMKLSADLRLPLPNATLITPSVKDAISDNNTIAGRRVQAGFPPSHSHSHPQGSHDQGIQPPAPDGSFSIFRPIGAPASPTTHSEGVQSNSNPQPEIPATDVSEVVEPPKKRGRGRPRKHPSELAINRKKKNKKMPSPAGASDSENMSPRNDQIINGNGQSIPVAQTPAPSHALAPRTQTQDKNQGEMASPAGMSGAEQMTMPGDGRQNFGAQVAPFDGGHVAPAQIHSNGGVPSTSMPGNEQPVGAQAVADALPTPAASTPDPFGHMNLPVRTSKYTSDTMINVENNIPSHAQPQHESHFDNALWHIKYQTDLDDRYQAGAHRRGAAALPARGENNIIDLSGGSGLSAAGQQQGTTGHGLNSEQHVIDNRAGDATSQSEMPITGSRRIGGPSINEVLTPSLPLDPRVHTVRWAGRRGPAATAIPAVNPLKVMKSTYLSNGRLCTRNPVATLPARGVMPAWKPDLSVTTPGGEQEEDVNEETEEDPHARVGGSTTITEHMDFSNDPELEHLSVYYDKRYDE